ncbi:hypothetical protein [Calothrix sp. UHCC 0171]|uniref:hypothetical protein n=1 Tax=Calothrix sp. UHCC 0171 TaxID=3110245 RepID=UPI002B1F4971|nr:hypothetical protein [Calothrix sp. UHCC 0171]MEA5569883.1 hypothetical protein [Calothrix sp. UHCC 0171]
MRREPNLCLLPQVENQVFAPTSDTYIDLAIALLTHYSFDLSGYQASDLVLHWESQFPVNWLHLAVVEALYQGRYKAFSVQQILTIWQRREQATFHFNMEFERLICSKFPESLSAMPVLPSVSPTSNYSDNSHFISVSSSIPALNHTAKTIDSDIENKYKEEQPEKIPEWAVIRKPPIPNLQVVDADNQSHVATQMVKFLPAALPPASHHAPIEQFSPEKSDRTDELFASKMRAIVEVEESDISFA